MKKLLLLSLLFLTLSFEVSADPGLILLRESTIDPSVTQTQSARTLECVPTNSGKRQYIIQPAKNFSTEEMRMIEDSGVLFLDVIPPNAYYILAGEPELEALKDNTELLYIGEYLPEYKTTADSRIAMAGKEGAFTAIVFLTSQSEYEEVSKLLPGCETICEDPLIIQADVTEDQVSKLTKLSAVKYVEVMRKFTIFNDVSKTENLMNVEAVNRSGYTGKGVTVCVADTGLDSGKLSTLHPDFQNKNVTGVICSTNHRDKWSDLNGHGTHVSGSVLGTGSNNYLNAGMAPDASLYFICCGDEGNSIYTPVESDVKGAYDAGARIMSNSWGDGAGATYTAISYMWDSFANKFPDMLILFAAGNSNKNIDTENNSSISSTSSAKNVLTVAAAESYRPSSSKTYHDIANVGEDTVFYNDKIAYPSDGKNQGMAYFSSRGPCKDGRTKPDICAPGTLIKSTESIYDSQNNGTRRSYYTSMSGTSMATPLTAGACADILQFLIESGVEKPSSALIKAVLINGARTMGTGQYRDVVEIPDVSPNCVNGFGHVDLKESLYPESGGLFFFEGSLSNTGDEVSYIFENSFSGAANFTLCWNDSAGSVFSQKILVNDLDLTVTADKAVYLPNGLESGSDSINNVEKCHVNSFPTGNATVKVKAARIMRGPQSFALVVSGMDELIPEPSIFLATLLIALLLGRKSNRNS